MNWKKIRRFLIILFTLGLVVFGTIFIDLKITRGFYFAQMMGLENRQSVELPSENSNCVYEITATANGTYHFRFANNSITPKYFTAYRNSDIKYELDDTLFFAYAKKPEISMNESIIGDSDGWTCGTGLGFVSINPFDSFEMNYTYDDLINSTANFLDFWGGIDMLDGVVYDYSALQDTNGFIVLDPILNHLSNSDTVEVRYHLEVTSVTGSSEFKVESNPIKLSYLDLIKRWVFNRNNEHLLYG